MAHQNGRPMLPIAPQPGLRGEPDDARMARRPVWCTPELSTPVGEAAVAYQVGVAALVADLPGARSSLARAVTLDDDFLLAHVALAATEGRSYRSARRTASASRPERQHAEVVARFFGSDPAGALDLRREHLAEFPGDLLVVWLPLAAAQRRD